MQRLRIRVRRRKGLRRNSVTRRLALRDRPPPVEPKRPLCAKSEFLAGRRLAASGHSRRVGHHGVWPKRCIHAERRGMMQISESRYVVTFPLQSHPRDVKTESTRKWRACRLAPPISSYRPLKGRTGSAILKSLSVSIVLTQPSCRLVIQPCMKSSTPVLALRSLPALEAIGSDSDLVAQAT